MENEEVYKRRVELSRFVEKFHKETETLTPTLKKKILDLRSKKCIFLMTAHQPNLFAYSGIFRKATLTYTLAKQIENSLGVKVVNFFGIADQDFTHDRWVKSTLLPSICRKNGVLTLRIKLPKYKMLCRVPKPSKNIINRWKKKIKKWIEDALISVNKYCKDNQTTIKDWTYKTARIKQNFDDFWDMVEDAFQKTTSYSDFNAFIMTKIINDIWGYDTLFARFSECQRIFTKEFSFILSNINEYHNALYEAIQLDSEGGVSKIETNLAPFWYHCNCGSKARLTLMTYSDSLFGVGRCLGCNKNYNIDLGNVNDPDVSTIADRISARSISMNLVFFKGLGVSWYTSGLGGYKYLMQARYVANKLHIPFPPTIYWRPHDKYLGISQLEALVEFYRITGNFKINNWKKEKKLLKSKIEKTHSILEELETEKEEIVKKMRHATNKNKIEEKLRSIIAHQNKIKREANLSVLKRDLKILENAPKSLETIPSIIDYAINIGLKQTSEQWIRYLTENGDLSSDINLKSIFDNLHFFKRKYDEIYQHQSINRNI